MSDDDPEDEQATEEYWRAGFQILLEEGRRTIDNQLRELSDLRSRAGALMGFAGLALSVVLATHHHPNHHKVWALGVIIAAVGLIGVISSTLAIQRPVGLSYGLGGDKLADEVRAALTPSGAMENVGSFHVENFNRNTRRLRPLQWVYFLGLCAFFLELLGLTLVVL